MAIGAKRRLKPTISVAFVWRTTFRQSFTRASDRSIGFSQKIALPARAKRSIRSAWVSVGVQITTASISLSASIASIVFLVFAYNHAATRVIWAVPAWLVVLADLGMLAAFTVVLQLVSSLILVLRKR